MSNWKEQRICIRPDGSAELQVDLVKRTVSGEEKRLKATRRQVDGRGLFRETCASTVLPHNCRFLCRVNETYTYYIIEEPPRIHTVTWEYTQGQWNSLCKRGLIRKYGLTLNDVRRIRFRLAFPFTIFIIAIKSDSGGYNSVDTGSCRVAIRTEPMRSLDDELSWAPFTNINSASSHMCLGHYRQPDDRRPSVLVDSVVDHWWGGSFNDHWQERCNTYRQRIPELKTVWDWEYHSRRRPMWVLDADWITMATSVPKLLELTGRTPKDAEQFDVLSNRITGLPEVGTEEIRRRRLEEEGQDRPQTAAPETQEKPRDKVAVIDGHEIKAGTRFRILPNDDLRSLPSNHDMQIRSLEVDDDGDVRITMRDYNSWHYITYNGGTLLPCVRFLIPELKNGVFTYADQQLRVGMIACVEDGATQIKGKNLKVAKLIEEDGTFFVTFEGCNQNFKLCENGELKMKWSSITYEFTERKVTLDRATIDLDTLDHLLVVGIGSRLQYGTLYKVLKFVKSERPDAHELDVDLLIEHGNEPIPVIEKSRWVFSSAYVMVRAAYNDGLITINRGDVFVCQTNLNEHAKMGDEFTVLCFDETNIYFDNGIGISLSQRTLAEFLKPKSGPLFSNDQVKRVPNDITQARRHFSKANASLNEAPKILVDAYNSRDKLKQYGKQIGLDINGKPVCVGDMVKVVSRDLSVGSPVPDRHVGGLALVIHYGTNYGTDHFTYLFFAQYLSSEPMVNGRTNYSRLDEVYMSSDMRRQIALSSAPHLEVVEFKTKPKTKPKDSVGIAEGAYVRIRSGITPEYGFGKVKPCEVGRVKQIAKKEVVIEFPSDPEWIGLIKEVELYPFVPGQSVVLKPNRSPRFSKGNAEQGKPGTIRERLADGILVVDFPTHKGWFGDEEDLQLAV